MIYIIFNINIHSPKLLKNLKAGESIVDNDILIEPKDVTIKQDNFTSIMGIYLTLYLTKSYWLPVRWRGRKFY